MNEAEKQLSELEGRVVEMNATKNKIKKRIKRSKDSFKRPLRKH